MGSACAGSAEGRYLAPLRARVSEFLGGKTPERATAVYACAVGPGPADRGGPARPSGVGGWLDRGWDVSRSLWDRRSLLFDLDLEYVHFERPLEVYLRPQRPFRLQEPVLCALRTILSGCGIAPLHVLSGRGHHLVWSVARTSAAFSALCAVGEQAVLAGDATQPFAGWAGRPDPAREAAFLGAGLLLEYVADAALRLCPAGEVPVELTAVEPGSGVLGREVVSLDLSEYGDPLETRTLRVPFGPYLKVQGVALCAIPWDGDLDEGVALMREPDRIAALAEECRAGIPEQAVGTERLLARYRASRVAEVHREYYREPMRAPETWPEDLPACARLALEDAEGALLTPAGIQLVSRVFLALGWHPRHVAALIRSRWERHGATWGAFSPARRADFYVRLFTTAIATGRDRLVSFNCRSQAERGACAAQGCRRNLLELRESLLRR